MFAERDTLNGLLVRIEIRDQVAILGGDGVLATLEKRGSFLSLGPDIEEADSPHSIFSCPVMCSSNNMVHFYLSSSFYFIMTHSNI